MNLSLLVALWLTWVVVGVVAEWRARRRLQVIPHRILVSGGRGKTTMVRLIHAGLRASHCHAVGRISGDRPAVIETDGTELPQRRWGPANIRELRRLLNRRTTPQIDAAVVENMAINPELQTVVARQMVRPTLAVMAPDALDHLEVLPADPETRVGLQLAALPGGMRVLLPAGEPASVEARCSARFGLAPILAAACPETGLRPYMSVLTGMALEAVDQVCGRITAEAREAVLNAAIKLQRITVYRRGRVAWVDGLSANDPAAAATLAAEVSGEAARRGYSLEARLFNHRADRPSRLALFSRMLNHRGPAWIVGEPFPPGWAPLMKASRLTGSPRAIVCTIEDALAEHPGSAHVLCLGNTGGTGHPLRQWLASHSQVESW